MNNEVINQLAPNGALKAGIYLGNFLLVTSKDNQGNPEGVSPDLAYAIAKSLNVKIQLIPFDTQGELVEAVAKGICGIGLVGSDPDRAQKITFAPAYVEIEATYLVPPNSPLNAIEDVDTPGVRIASFKKSAYDLWLVRNIKNASLVHADTLEASVDLFFNEKLDALAGLKTGLIKDSKRLPGSAVLDGQFMAVQQGVATAKENLQSIEFLSRFVQDAKQSGLIASFIKKHKVNGLSVAA
ncbi:transporter substrate-binding domain-containing protein [Polynucleobacter sp. JS-JIR-5-A7]|uniref:transporter substrate-binding domain-containing protein n=1 Tax=Polynucleobacter sp. JS-JIR-5-A7 TaxID=1758395 RepID=UPI001BFDD86A|nr:transporter substrate-binding domain-containing protein [Polynucleobacter sp. JS-JIR-5-A7]QWE07191.1 transporter substrate-binding domain-containing protein [Polynucleobacter sp. JS-JIR-5-A7]